MAGRSAPRNDAAEGLLSGLPEMALFPNDETRHAAAARLATSFNAGEFVLGGLLCVAVAGIAMVATYSVSQWALAPYAGPWVSVLTMLAGGVGGYVLVLRWLYRSSLRTGLRKELEACGVPVCLKCGYSLRGLPATQLQCPECGQAVSDRSRELLNDNAEPERPAGSVAK